MVERPDDNFVNGGNDHLPKGLVGLVTLVEDNGGDVMGLSKVGDIAAQCNQWDGGLGAGVDKSDEGCSRECCVHGGGDVEL